MLRCSCSTFLEGIVKLKLGKFRSLNLTHKIPNQGVAGSSPAGVAIEINILALFVSV